MSRGLDIAFFGSSIVSAYRNGAATYYRGLLRALHARGHRITFYEPDAYDRQKHRDIAPPSYADVVVYSETEGSALAMLDRARRADVIVKASRVGVFDELLEREVLRARRPAALAIFWDVDAPATLERLRRNDCDPLRRLVSEYDLVFTCGGGPPVIRGYRALGAREVVPIYNALDPETHFAVAAEKRFAVDLALLANRSPDRESRTDDLFFGPAELLSDRRFLLGGSGWEDKRASSNVTLAGHIYTADHNAFNASASLVLDVARDSTAACGWLPAARIFEAAGAAACVITDAWDGIEDFLEPGREILVATNGDDVARHVRDTSPARAKAMGEAARRRVLEHHTYARRARVVEAVLYAVRGYERCPRAMSYDR